MNDMARPEPTPELFDANAETYDRVNTIISLGLDRCWRGWVVRQALDHAQQPRLLDAFSGTGPVGLEAAKRGARVTLADDSPGMLALARSRAARRKLDVRSVLVDLTASPLEVPGAPFDAVAVVFGVRYLSDPVAVLARLGGLLGEGGRLVALEFCEPRGGMVSRLAGWYFFRVIPPLAGMLAGDRELYDTLARTTHALGGPDRLPAIVRDAGLCVDEVRLMGFGLVVGVVAHRG